MHTHSLTHWTHGHSFLGAKHVENERRTWLVVALTAAMMVGEIAGGMLYGSMALVADGWHMSTHAGALAVAALAYRYARSHVQDARFSFGTGKLGELAGYSSALILGVIALLIGYESTARLLNPVAISFDEATVIAVIGLGVNLASASQLAAKIKGRLEVGTDRVADLHLWRVGPGHAAVIAAIVTDQPKSPDRYKARLQDLGGLSHITIEVHVCRHSMQH